MGIFIAVAVILVLLNLFFVFIIRALGARIGNFAQSNMLRQSSVFDELILRKEETLQGLLSSIDAANLRLRDLAETTQTKTDYGVPLEHHAVIPGNYMNPDFSRGYKQIRENFLYDKGSLVRRMTQYFQDDPEDGVTLAARAIIEMMDSDTCYLLSTLSPEDQFEVLSDTFDMKQNVLLKVYEGVEPNFEGFEFVNWLKEYIFKNGNDIVVRTGMASDNFDAIDDRIRTEFDDSLIEGLYVIHKGILYDYSIRGKEISG